MFAYFIGGPWDLVKRAMPSKDMLSTYRVPQLTDPLLFAKGDTPARYVEVTRHEYRRLFTEDEYTVYIYQGVR